MRICAGLPTPVATRNNQTPPPSVPPTDPPDSVDITPNGKLRIKLGTQILATPDIILRTDLPSGTDPKGADPHSNIQSAADGKASQRSNYENAPGGTVLLDTRMLNGMLAMHDTNGYNLEITAICGGSHSKNSRHYAGLGFDVWKINGVEVSADDPFHADFMKAIRGLGATEVLGPGNTGHDHHVHAAWPRVTTTTTNSSLPDAPEGGMDEKRR